MQVPEAVCDGELHNILHSGFARLPLTAWVAQAGWDKGWGTRFGQYFKVFFEKDTLFDFLNCSLPGITALRQFVTLSSLVSTAASSEICVTHLWLWYTISQTLKLILFLEFQTYFLLPNNYNKGRVSQPKQMNFWKSSKRPLIPPLIFRKSYCRFRDKIATKVHMFIMAGLLCIIWSYFP